MAATARPAAPAAAAPADRRLRAVWDAVRRPGVAVVSTDVFDTLVWRQVPEPVHAFGLAGGRMLEARLLADGLSAAAFGALREQAEVRARELAPAPEITLDEVYALFPDWVFRHSAEGRRRALELELELERDLLVPDLDVLAVLLAAKDAGKRVVAVSDTYFTEPMLRGLLDQPALRELELDAVFVSGVHRVNKSGGLFDVVLRTLGVAAEEVVHLGDNEDADVRFPSALGIACAPFERLPDALRGVLAAEARHARPPQAGRPTVRGEGAAGVLTDLTSLRGKVAAREEGAAVPGALRPFWTTGALVHGPVLTGFAEWVQDRAQMLGVRRVHGFMREGGFLGALVDRAGEYLGTDVRAAPLWLNREVLSAAALGDVTADELRPLMVRRRTPTVERFLRSVGLAPGDLPRFATHAETSLDDGVTRENLLAAIEADAAARAKVLDHARAMRDRVVRYALRELADDARLVCVDLGWAGSAQGLLAQALRNAGVDVPVDGLYLALHEGGARRVFEGERALGYLAEYGFPGDATPLLVRSPEVLEQICMPAHGSQVGLGDDLEPVLDDALLDPRQAAEAQAARSGVLAFQREWARYQVAVPGKLGSLAGAQDLLRPILLRSVTSPTEEEVAAFGTWLHDTNQGSDEVETVVGDLPRHLDPAGLRDLPMSDLYWPFAAASRVDATWGALIDAAAAGLIPWDALSGEAETGRFSVAVSRGALVPEGEDVGGVPVRNRFGLSSLHGTLRAGAVHEVVIRPCEAPAIVRFDHLELRCWAQGRDEPVVIRLQAPADFARLGRENAFVLNPNVFIAHSTGAALYLDLTGDVAGHVFRVDVRAGFAVMGIGEVLPTPGRIRNPEEAGVRVEQLEALVSDLQSSLSWRVTRPLRAAKGRLGR